MAAILLLVYAHHNWIANFASPALWWKIAYGLAFASFQRRDGVHGAGDVIAPAHSSLKVLDAMQPSAYGIYLLHYIFIIWLQYVVYDPALPAGVKAAIVFVGTLSGAGCDRRCCEKFRLWRE